MMYRAKQWVSGFLMIGVVFAAPSLLAQEDVITHEDLVAKVARDIEAGAHKGVTGGIISMNGEIIMEAYAPGYNAAKRHDIRSATKSITALLIGALVDDKKLKSIRVELSDILTDEFSSIDPRDPKRSIRIEDLLTMRGGLACDDWTAASVGHEDKMYKTDDWFSFWLESPVAYEVGKHFSYCTGGVVTLGRALEKLSGAKVSDYAEEKLFGPLGIEGATWEKTPQGYTDTGGHLRLRLNDLHTIGLLVAAGGMWNGKQIISKGWISTMTKPHTRIPERREQYGYLWWYNEGKIGDQPINLLYAHGNGGNFIFIIPEISLVAAFTGKNYGNRLQFTAMQILTRELVPVFIENRKP